MTNIFRNLVMGCIVTAYTMGMISIGYYKGTFSGFIKGYNVRGVKLTEKLRESVEDGFNEPCPLPSGLERIADFDIKEPRDRNVLIFYCGDKRIEYKLELSRVVSGGDKGDYKSARISLKGQ